jgi:hypothetical protein
MFLTATAKRGVDVTDIGRFPEMLRGAGFEDVHEEKLRWPLGPWSAYPPGSEDAKHEIEVGVLAGQNFLDGLPMFAEAFGRRVLGWT